MNKEFAQKWVEALRSGKYKQYLGGWVNSLRNPTEFCCLSVALTEAGKFEDWRMPTGGRVANLLDLHSESIKKFITMNDKEKKVIR